MSLPYDAIVPVEPGKSGAQLSAQMRLRCVVAASFALAIVACIALTGAGGETRLELAIRVPQRERERLGEELVMPRHTDGIISKLTRDILKNGSRQLEAERQPESEIGSMIKTLHSPSVNASAESLGQFS